MVTDNNCTAHEVEQETIPSIHRLYFYLTESCNLSCRHCYLAPKFDSTGDKYSTIPIELFKTAIREAKPLGLKHLKLTGGEPLLHPQFEKLLAIVRSEGLSLNIETNGMLCTAKIASEIAKSPQRFVGVSIDGVDSATHDWIRGVPGSFERAKQAVRNLAAVDTPPQIIMSIMRCNVDQVEALVRLAENLGASSVKFNIVQPMSRGEMLHETSATLDVGELITLGRYVDMELTRTTKLKLFFDYPMAFRPLSRIDSGNGCGVCGVLGILGVISSGNYALCGIGTHVPELVFGVVGEDRLEHIWQHHTTLRSLRAGLPDRLSGTCGRCLMRKFCFGTCVAHNYYRTGSLWEPYWFCEQAEAQGLFPDTRLATTAGSL
jgi:SynChlorMet cassette radical SAM/SPASM protein ScmF